MFIVSDYISYLNQQIRNRVLYYGVDTTHIYLEALYQFDTEPKNYLKTIHPTTLSKKYKHIFGKINKPKSVSYNYWFLYTYGYKYCSGCNEIKKLQCYNKDKHAWDSLYNLCNVCQATKQKSWVKNNLDKSKEINYTYRNKNKEKLSCYNKEYRLNHLAEDAARSMKRYTAKLKATPPWLTQKHFEDILCFYRKAKELEKETGIKHHVDHIIPLQGLNVCGLHVPWNLQVLTANDNLIKSNKISI